MFTKTPDPIRDALNELLSIAAEIARADAIVASESEEMTQRFGRGAALERALNDLVMHGPEEVRKALNALLRAKAKAVEVSEPLAVHAAEMEAEMRRWRDESLALVRGYIVENIRPFLHDRAERVAAMAPAVVAEEEFWAKHPISDWAGSIRTAAGHYGLTDRENTARKIARLYPLIVTAHEKAKEHAASVATKYRSQYPDAA